MKSILLLLSACIFFCVNEGFAETITILHVNDSHSCLSAGAPRDADLNGTVGGIARAASVIMQEKSLDPSAIVLHAGDIFIGDLFFNNFFGVPELGMLQQLGFDAICPGNHEFDLGPGALIQSLDAAYSESKVPLVSINLDMEDVSVSTLKDYVQDYIIKNINGVKVGIFGISSPKTNILSNPAPVTVIEDFGGKMAETIQALKQEGCAIIVLLSGLGLENEKELAAGAPYIDIIIGGDDHFVMNAPVEVDNASGGTTYIVQAGPHYKNLGKFTIEFDNGIQSVNWENITLDVNIPELPQIAEVVNGLISEMEKNGNKFYTEKIADATEDILIRQTPEELLMAGNRDMPAGNLICDAFLDKYPEADLAIQPGGSMSQPLYKGPVVTADIYRMISYGFNTDNGLGFRMVTFDISGAELIKGLEYCLSTIESNDEFFIHCAGMTYQYNVNGEPFARILQIKINGELIDTMATYKVVTNEFVPMVFSTLGFAIQNVEIKEGVSEFEVVSDFVKNKGTVSPVKDGRILGVIIDDVRELKGLMRGKLNIFPNPCGKSINLSANVSPGEYHIMIIDLFGREMLAKNCYLGDGECSLQIPTAGLSHGKYFLIMTGNNFYGFEPLTISE